MPPLLDLSGTLMARLLKVKRTSVSVYSHKGKIVVVVWDFCVRGYLHTIFEAKITATPKCRYWGITEGFKKYGASQHNEFGTSGTSYSKHLVIIMHITQKSVDTLPELLHTCSSSYGDRPTRMDNGTRRFLGNDSSSSTNSNSPRKEN